MNRNHSVPVILVPINRGFRSTGVNLYKYTILGFKSGFDKQIVPIKRVPINESLLYINESIVHIFYYLFKYQNLQIFNCLIYSLSSLLMNTNFTIRKSL